MATSATSSVPAGSQISPANERLYKQSNLIGDWKGSYTKTKQPVEFKVLSIKGDTAQVEYTHNGHVDRGTATVSKNMITFDNVTIATRNGTNGVIEFDGGVTKFSGVLTKDAAASKTPDGPLVGTWSGSNSTTGDVASFTVKSVKGNDADISYTIDGITRKGTGSVFQNIIRMGNVQIAVNPDKTGKVTFTKLGQSLTIGVKPVSTSTTSTTSKFA